MERSKLKIVGPFLPWGTDVRRGVLLQADGQEDPVLLRVLREVPAEPEALARLQKRAKRLARARSEGLVRLVHVSAFGPNAALVYAHVEGASLERVLATQRLRQGLLPIRTCLELAAAIARCLVWAQDDVERRVRGHTLHHPGLAPQDVLIDLEGRVLLAGLEVLAVDEAPECRPAGPYCAPEGCAGAPALVYALAVITLELLTQQPPPTVSDPRRRQEALTAMLARGNQRPGEPAPPAAIQLLDLALAPDPEQRPPLHTLATQLDLLARTLRGPGLPAWAGAAIPRAMGRRREDELSAAIPIGSLAEPESPAAGSSAAALPDPPEPAPEVPTLEVPPAGQAAPTWPGLDSADALEPPIEAEAALDPWIPPESPNPLRTGDTFFVNALDDDDAPPPPSAVEEEPPMASAPRSPKTPSRARTAPNPPPTSNRKVGLLLALVALICALGGLGALGVLYVVLVGLPGQEPEPEPSAAAVQAAPEPEPEPVDEPEPAEEPAPEPAARPAQKAPSKVKIAPPKETIAVPPPTPEPAPTVAPFNATFISGQEGTLLTVSCHRGSAIGSGATIIVRGAEPGPCKVSGKTREGAKLSTSVVLEGPGSLTCFAGGEQVCQ